MNIMCTKVNANTKGRSSVGRILACYAMLLVVVWGALPASAQSFKATVVGRITDSNGAAVPGVSVTLTEQGTGRRQSATTNEEGSYTVPQLTPGRYDVRVEGSNFKAIQQTGLVLETASTMRLDFTLEVGPVAETVTIVEAEAPLVNTDTSSKGEVITPAQVENLPLNGRNYVELALLVPGVYRRPADDDQGEGLAVAGTRTDATNFILDGVNNRSDRNGNVGASASVDAIREFKVLTSTYSAEFGRTAGAQINVVSKSGSNDLNGSLFFYLRNDIFDAANFFSGAKELRRGQFGGTIGGPLPFFNFGEGGPLFKSGRDRTFFFLSYEGTREARSESSLNTAPHADWLRGDFRNVRGPGANGILGDSDDTNRVLNPFDLNSNGTPREFSTPNLIPQNLINPISRQILAFIPAANVPGSLTGYVANGLATNERNQYLAKIDHRFTQNNNFYVSYARSTRLGFDPFPSNRNFYPGFGRDADQLFNTLAVSDTHVFSPRFINEIRFGLYDQNSQNLGQNRHTDYLAVFGIPTPNAYSPGEALQGFPAIRIDGFSEFGDRPNDPFTYKLRNYQLYDMSSLVVGNHNIKFGADILRANYREADVRNVRGDFRFRGRSTNPSGGAGGSTSSGFRSFADFLLGLPDSTQLQLGAEPADLTGWQYAFFIQDDWRASSRLTLNLGLRYELQKPLTEASGRLANFIPQLGAVVQSGDPRFPESLVETDKNNWGPRVGFALRPFNDDRTVLRGGAGIYYSLETFNPIRQQLAVTFPFIERYEFTRVSSGTTRRRSLSFNNPFPLNQGGLRGLNEPFGLQVDYEQPTFYQYNLTLERELLRDLAFEIGYVGAQGRHLGRRYNLNQPRPTGQINSEGDPVTVTPYPQFGTIQYQEQTANSHYNALQTSLRRRQRNGLTLLVSYTFSRAIDTASSTNNSTTGTQKFPQNIYNFAAEKGLSDFHRKHQFNASFNYQLPFGRGRAFLSEAGGLADALFGGWQFNGIVTLLSGRPFTPTFSARDVSEQRPDIVGDPFANVPAGLYFNPAAFARPVATPQDPTLFGNAGRNILIGPNFKSVDLSLMKSFRLSEGLRLQFRAESFNAFNHPNFQVPVFQIDNPNAGQLTQTANEGREFQFALKLLF